MTPPNPGRRAFLAAAAAAPAARLAGGEALAAPTSPAPPTRMSELARAVQGVIAAGRIGRPVFARLTVVASDTPDASRLAKLAAVAAGWIGQPVETVYAIASAAGQMTVTLRFHGGLAAQVSAARGTPRGDGVDLLLLGSNGAIHFDAGTGPQWEAPLVLPDAASKLAPAVERALKSGQAEPVAKGEQP